MIGSGVRLSAPKWSYIIDDVKNAMIKRSEVVVAPRLGKAMAKARMIKKPQAPPMMMEGVTLSSESFKPSPDERR